MDSTPIGTVTPLLTETEKLPINHPLTYSPDISSPKLQCDSTLISHDSTLLGSDTASDEITLLYTTIAEGYFSKRASCIQWRKNQLKQLQIGLKTYRNKIVNSLKFFKNRECIELEIEMVFQELDYCLKNIVGWCKPRTISTAWVHFLAKTTEMREPIGKILIITTWNYPFMCSIMPLIAVIMTGNCGVLKLSEHVTEFSFLIKSLVEKYLDPQYFRCITGGVDYASELLKFKWDHIFFTGSTKTGKIIAQSAAQHLTPMTLDLGGMNPTLVDGDNVDLYNVAKRLVFGKWVHCGQACLAIDYVICLPHVKDRLVHYLKCAILEFYGENITNNKEYPRMINIDQTRRVVGVLNNLNHGEKIEYGGTYNIRERFIEPTILSNIDPISSTLMDDGLFGPILPIIQVACWKDAIEYIQYQKKSLASYLFTQDSKLIEYFKSNVSSGSMVINDCHIQLVDCRISYGGIGDSGMGKYRGKASFDLLTHPKQIIHRRMDFTNIINEYSYPPINLSILLPVIFPYRFHSYEQFGEWWRLIYPFSFFFWLYSVAKALFISSIGWIQKRRIHSHHINVNAKTIMEV